MNLYQMHRCWKFWSNSLIQIHPFALQIDSYNLVLVSGALAMTGHHRPLHDMVFSHIILCLRSSSSGLPWLCGGNDLCFLLQRSRRLFGHWNWGRGSRPHNLLLFYGSRVYKGVSPGSGLRERTLPTTNASHFKSRSWSLLIKRILMSRWKYIIVWDLVHLRANTTIVV